VQFPKGNNDILNVYYAAHANSINK